MSAFAIRSRPHRALERQHGRADRLGRAVSAECLPQTLHGARVQLRDARFVHADLRANLLHRRFAVVVEPDHLALARRQRRNGGADAVADFLLFVRPVGRLWLGGHERRRQRRAVDVLAGRQRRRRFDRVDPHDGASEPRLVRSDSRGEVRERRLGTELAPQFLARRFELAALTPDAARPRVATKRVDHRAANAALGKRLELDAAVFVEAAGGVDQADHPVLHQVAQLDRVRHGRGDATRERFHERKTCGDALTMTGGEWLTLHLIVSSKTAVAVGRVAISAAERVAAQLGYQEKRSKSEVWLGFCEVL